MDILRIEPRTQMRGCGIYEAGDADRCYVKLFITDSGCVLPVNHRVITEEDLMKVYQWGWEDGEASREKARRNDAGQD